LLQRRKVAVTLSSLVSDREYQLTLFDDRERLGRLERTVDAIRDRFGDTAVMRAASVTEAGQAKRRSIMIGGHYK
jgi:DNA polymerase-4